MKKILYVDMAIGDKISNVIRTSWDFNIQQIVSDDGRSTPRYRCAQTRGSEEIPYYQTFVLQPHHDRNWANRKWEEMLFGKG